MKQLIRIETDGTKVYRKNNKIFRVAPSDPADWRSGGYYGPFGSRRAFLAGKKDHRETPEFAEHVRADRQRLGVCFRAVKPGPQ